jgi:Arylsulfatase A and related enzymes
MGHADMGYQSTDLSKATPFMDSLAASGVKLTSYYTQVGRAREAKALDSAEKKARLIFYDHPK